MNKHLTFVVDFDEDPYESTLREAMDEALEEINRKNGTVTSMCQTMLTSLRSEKLLVTITYTV